MMMFISLAATLIAVALFIVACRAFYFAFIKRKDERSKWVVIKSMADSFFILICLQAVQAVFKWANYETYQHWRSALTAAVYIEPVLLSFMVLGIVLIVNTKKNGGSL